MNYKELNQISKILDCEEKKVRKSEILFSEILIIKNRFAKAGREPSLNELIAFAKVLEEELHARPEDDDTKVKIEIGLIGKPLSKSQKRARQKMIKKQR